MAGNLYKTILGRMASEEDNGIQDDMGNQPESSIDSQM
jgi:hypothetical protein